MAFYNTNQVGTSLQSGTYNISGNTFFHQIQCISSGTIEISALGGGNFTWGATSGQFIDVVTKNVVVSSGEFVGFSTQKIDYTYSASSYNANAQALFDYLLANDTYGLGMPDVVKPYYSDLFQSWEDTGVWENSNFRAIICPHTLNAFDTLVEVKSLSIISSFASATAPPYNNARAEIPTFAGYSFNNGHIQTGFIPSTIHTLNNFSEMIVLYQNETASTNTFNYGAFNGASQSSVFSTKINTGALVGDGHSTTVGTGRVSVAAHDGAKGVYIKNRRSSTYMGVVKNGTTIGSITGSTGTRPTVEIYLNCFNSSGVAQTRRNQSPICMWVNFGSGLTSQQEVDLTNSASAWQIGLERISGVHDKQIVLDGNSHTVYWMSMMNRTMQFNLVKQGWTFDNVGVSGQLTSGMTADYSTEVAPKYNSAFTQNILILVEGTNSMYVGGRTKDQAISDMASLVSAAQATGWVVGVKKQFCRANPTSGPGLATYSSATVWNLAVSAYNDDLDAGLTGADFIIPVSSDHFISYTGGSTTTYNTAVSALITNNTNFHDTTHLTELGYKTEGELNVESVLAL